MGAEKEQPGWLAQRGHRSLSRGGNARIDEPAKMESACCSGRGSDMCNNSNDNYIYWALTQGQAPRSAFPAHPLIHCLCQGTEGQELKGHFGKSYKGFSMADTDHVNGVEMARSESRVFWRILCSVLRHLCFIGWVERIPEWFEAGKWNDQTDIKKIVWGWPEARGSIKKTVVSGCRDGGKEPDSSDIRRAESLELGKWLKVTMKVKGL